LGVKAPVNTGSIRPIGDADKKADAARWRIGTGQILPPHARNLPGPTRPLQRGG